MKANFYTESILYWLARGVSALAQRLPPRGNAALGRAAGILFYHLTAPRRRTALDNLRAAFGGAYSPGEYRRILRGLYRNLGMVLLEVAAIPRIDRAYVDRWVTLFPGSRERLEEARAKGKGVIFLTGHFGNWELNSIAGALLGYPILLLAREQGWPKLNRMLTAYRESKGCRVVTKGFAVRDLVRGLREGNIIGILADQDAGRRGVLAPFFGRLASTAAGTIELSVRTGAPILPVFMVRRGGPAHHLILEEPLRIPANGTEKERVRAGVAAYLNVLEGVIRKHPDHWFWLHRRWKSTPERRILIFSDGKAGHRNQSAALAERMAAAWVEKMGGDERLKTISQSLVTRNEAEIRFRSPASRFLLACVASLAPRHFQGGEVWLRFCLTPESYRAIQSAHADIALSCGAGMAAVNLLWSWMIRARPVHVTRARFPSWRRFDLAVLPRHDLGAGVPKRGNLLVTDGALVPAAALNGEQATRWEKQLGLSEGKRIGLLLGGPPAKGRPLKRQAVEEAVRSLVFSARQLDAHLLVTTSRRTPPEWEEWLIHQLEGSRCCGLLTLVNRGRTGGLPETREAVPCILGMSDALVVSGDSISMVSEAVSTAKPVITFSPSPGSKQERFLKQMHVEGRLRLVEPADVGGAVSDALKRPTRPSPAGHPAAAVTEFLKKWL